MTDNDARLIGKRINTRAACSCWMCGNPRKFVGEQTIQERRHNSSDRV